MSLRLTPKRAQILNVLKAHKGSLSAAAIHTSLPNIDLVTIYRTLDLLVKEKIIKKIYLTGTEAQYEYQRSPHHHAICTECARVIHFDIADDSLAQLVNVQGFSIGDIELTVRGICDHTHR